ncbi:XdhC family protein [Echinicola sp. CAU 1574]|uniref:XdhC family protein n=1 Tax=Echinicola arenosa TaxID=2774144 RepID=A0ABR9AN98_9BACT|nr:XdhC/CoxI family protein [Echinicola arenosa]MBD8489348.1 XdhC family protein [Echinicola arenosa]
MKEIKSIISAYNSAKKDGKSAALATVVHVEGSSYRGPGARMLVADDGKLTGAISGGCLEGDALRKALMVMMQGKPLTQTYDTSDEYDAIIGVGLGCEGIIRVLIEPIDQNDPMNPIRILEQATLQREAAVLVTIFDLNQPRSVHQGTIIYAVEGQIENRERFNIDLSKSISDVLSNQRSSFRNLEYQGKELTAFMQYLPAPIRLVIAGAGNDIIPLVEMAEILGWEMILLDGRPSYADHHRFPNCQVIIGQPEKVLDQVQLDPRTAVLLMTHNYNYDRALVKRLVQLKPKYVGMLGPRKKWESIKKEMKSEKGSLLTFPMYSPVGLDVGAETAEEIALAIISEIKAVFSNRTGTFLHKFKDSIHPERNNISLEELIKNN